MTMQLLDLTLPTPEENLALDEALLEKAERGELETEVLRLWEPVSPLVVLGRSSKVVLEADAAACRRRGIPILRRTSGGATIVTGPGCLMYAVVLDLRRRPQLRAIDEAHAFVLGTLAGALHALLPDVSRQGTSDLVIGDRKFSGNSLRVKRDHLLYHGTLLYDFPLALVSEVLPPPPRQPDYRRQRPHDDFLTNLPIDAGTLRRAVIDALCCRGAMHEWPRATVAALIADKYSQADWNLRH